MKLNSSTLGMFLMGLSLAACSGDDTIATASATDTDTDTDTDTGTEGTTTLVTGTTGTSTTDATTTDATTTDATTTDSTTTTTTESTGQETSTTDVTATDTGGPSCDDAEQNGDETDVDCGGSCSPCADGQMCVDGVDCQSGSCMDGVCATIDPCTNGVMDGDESDVDCGGSCMVCNAGQMCNADDDCIAKCLDGVCEMTECVEDADCADLNTDCTLGACVDFACVANAANEDGPCDDGDLCSDGAVCTGGVCGGGAPKDCSALDSACSTGLCNPEDGECIAENAPNDTPCTAEYGCGGNAVCTDGACVDDGGVASFYEPFADNSQGWALDMEWEIGAAAVGCGDPGTDHTPTDDNGVAGVVLGDCASTEIHDYYCLTSPKIDVAGQADVWMSFWRDLYSDYTPYMKNKIEVWDGNDWVIIFETFGFPGVNDSDWTLFEYDLNPYVPADNTILLRWCMNIGSNGAFSRGSWNVDDVVVGPQMCQPY